MARALTRKDTQVPDLYSDFTPRQREELYESSRRADLIIKAVCKLNPGKYTVFGFKPDGILVGRIYDTVLGAGRSARRLSREVDRRHTDEHYQAFDDRGRYVGGDYIHDSARRRFQRQTAKVLRLLQSAHHET